VRRYAGARELDQAAGVGPIAAPAVPAANRRCDAVESHLHVGAPSVLAQSGLVPALRVSALMSLPLTSIDLPASWNLWIPVTAQRCQWR
jgi:hypothetical protein